MHHTRKHILRYIPEYDIFNVALAGRLRDLRVPGRWLRVGVQQRSWHMPGPIVPIYDGVFIDKGGAKATSQDWPNGSTMKH